ncbi:hypothetical protein FKP32DRAFT_1677616 [Trametes sanguinea]|nr:hypothetical protein FKP32DRAFT_1677616 [Trametes sanguinea]
MPAVPYPDNSRVFYLEGGRTQLGTVTGSEIIENLTFVIIKHDDKSRKPVKLPMSSVQLVTKDWAAAAGVA